MKLTIKRWQWLRGCEGSLCNRHGDMDVLGHYFIACGHKPDDIWMMGTPYSTSITPDDRLGVLTCDESEFPEWAWSWRYRIVDELMQVNDDDELTEEDREQTLIMLFADIGVELEFT